MIMRNKICDKNKNKYLIVILTCIMFLILFSNYTYNLFEIVDANWFANWALDSEGVVTKSLQKAIENGIGYSYGLLEGYPKQIGLQGMILRVLDLVFKRETVPVSFFHKLVVFSLCVLLFVFLYWVKKEFGADAAVIGYIVLFLNRWMIVTARNLYWVTFTLFLPFLSILLLAWKDEKKSINLRWFGLTSFLTIFIRAACGFEMISAAMISMEIPLFYYAYKNCWKREIFFKRFLVCAICALTAFIVALVINFLQQVGYFSSVHAAVDNILYTISKRTGLFNLAETNKVYRASLEAAKLSVLKIYLFDGEPLIGKLHMISLIWIAVVATSMCFIGKRYSQEIEKNRKKLHALCLAMWLSFLAPVSWYILASPHSYIHTGSNYLLWSFPCVLLVSILCGSIISYMYRDHRYVVYKYGVCFGGVICLILLYFYMDSCKVGNKYLKLVRENGRCIEDTENADVYYYDDSLYYLLSRGHEDKRVFLHLYPSEGSIESAGESGFVNSDFAFSSIELRTPVWEGTRIAKAALNKDFSISRIATGQFDETGMEWETDFELADYVEAPAQIVPDSLTDPHWTNGISNDGTTILMRAENELSLHMLEGRSLRTESGKVVRVKQVLKQGQWMHLILDEPVDVSEGYPHAYKLLSD